MCVSNSQTVNYSSKKKKEKKNNVCQLKNVGPIHPTKMDRTVRNWQPLALATVSVPTVRP